MNDENVYNTVRMLRSHGMVRENDNHFQKEEYKSKYPDLNPEFIFAYPAYNMRNTEIGGILGLNQLPILPANVSIRNSNHLLFLRNLDSKKFKTDFKLEGASNYAFNLILRNKDPDYVLRLMSVMRENGIEFRRGSAGGGNQLRQPYLKNIGFDGQAELYPNTDHVHFYGFYIGNFPSMEENEVKTICEIINGA